MDHVVEVTDLQRKKKAQQGEYGYICWVRSWQADRHREAIYIMAPARPALSLAQAGHGLLALHLQFKPDLNQMFDV